VPAVVDPGRHRAGGTRRPAVVAAALTAVVLAGAAVLVALGRDGGGPAPESLDRAAPTVSAPAPGTARTATPATATPATATPATAGAGAPGPAGTLRAAPRSSAPATTAAAPTPASRASRPAPATSRAAAPSAGGTATFYTLAGLPNCGYPGAAATGRYVALGPAAFAGSAACGTVLDVTGPKGTVRVTVADQCPECEPGHVDLAGPAFAAIADPVAGIVPVTVTRVADPAVGGPVRVRVKEGSSPYWLALLPMDTGNPLTAVAVKVGTGWTALQRTGYGYWVAATGAGPGPYQVRLTDDRGHTATATVPLSVGSTVDTGVRLY
jgi:expansin